MNYVRQYWLPGLLGLCAIMTLGLIAWPTDTAGPVPPASAQRYTGPDVQTRRGGAVLKFALRLEGPDAAPQVAPQPEALPVLVGIAGHRAYLRSIGSGEVERVSIGQKIGGWRLVAVSARAATLRGPGGDRRIKMFAVDPTTTAATDGASPSIHGE